MQILVCIEYKKKSLLMAYFLKIFDDDVLCGAEMSILNLSKEEFSGLVAQFDGNSAGKD